jgi:hypothetical protein
MKINQEDTSFKPIKITIETVKETENLIEILLDHSYYNGKQQAETYILAKNIRDYLFKALNNWRRSNNE